MPNLAQNKGALVDFKVLETLEAGVVLMGPEVKAVKSGNLNLKGSYVSIGQGQDAWLVDAHIGSYKPARMVQTHYTPTRRRKLLLKSQEIDYLRGKQREKGLTILPVSVYTKGSLIKVELAIAQGKKRFDKRESIKKRELDRDIRRKLRRK